VQIVNRTTDLQQPFEQYDVLATARATRPVAMRKHLTVNLTVKTSLRSSVKILPSTDSGI
jgi:hypothetical protein